jgi:hypothetical protein
MSSNKYRCERCCDLGVVSATLVKNEDLSNREISVLLCSHFDEGTEASITTLGETGIPVVIAGKAQELQPEDAINA